jgi:opacity protein-like surface antigen
MWRRLIVWGVLACAVGILVAAPAANAATPQQILNDYAKNGRLDHSYSKADLRAAQRYAAAQGYPRVGVQGAVQQALGAQAVKTSGGLPFTGLDLALMAIGGALLIGAGTTLRKLGHAKQQP